jgi:hypothetical protein
MRRCVRPGCVKRARKAYCSDRCASQDRQRRYRERVSFGPLAEPLEVREASVTVDVQYDRSAVVRFDGLDDYVPSAEIVELLADDAQRFRQMGYVISRRL